MLHVVASRGGGESGGMEAANIVPVLQERVATVPGGRDLDGRPLLVVVVQPTWTDGRLDTALRYCSSLFRYALPVRAAFTRQRATVLYIFKEYSVVMSTGRGTCVYVYTYVHVCVLLRIPRARSKRADAPTDDIKNRIPV